jgi:probable HAF family extracellular repeat protein
MHLPLAALILGLSAAAHAQVQLTIIGTFPGGETATAGSDCADVRADGQVVIGIAQTATAGSRAFRWTAATGIEDLGALIEDTSSIASRITGSGRVILGGAHAGGGMTGALVPARWFVAPDGTVGSPQPLFQNGLTPPDWLMRGISEDGGVVALFARGRGADTTVRSYRWTSASGLVELTGANATRLEAQDMPPTEQ